MWEVEVNTPMKRPGVPTKKKGSVAKKGESPKKKRKIEPTDSLGEPQVGAKFSVEVPDWEESASVEGFRLVQGESVQKKQQPNKGHPQPASKKRKRKESNAGVINVDTTIATVASPPATSAATPLEQSASEEPRKKKRRRGKRGGKKSDTPVPPEAQDSVESADRHEPQAKTKKSNTPRRFVRLICRINADFLPAKSHRINQMMHQRNFQPSERRKKNLKRSPAHKLQM